MDVVKKKLTGVKGQNNNIINAMDVYLYGKNRMNNSYINQFYLIKT